MKGFLIAGVSALVFASAAASAADMAANAPYMAAPAGYDWGGFYVGGHLAETWSSHSSNAFDNSLAFETSTSSSDSAFSYGFQGGYNWMLTRNWLLGVEISGSWVDSSSTVTGSTATGSSSSHIVGDFDGALLGRLGYAWNNWLFYGTGGLVLSQDRIDRTVTASLTAPGLVGMTVSSSPFATGWGAGGGIEWGFAPHLTAKVQYLHSELDNVHSDFAYPGFPSATRHDLSDTKSDQVVVGVNWLFSQP